MKSRPDVAVKEGTEDIAVVNAAAEVKVAEGQGMSRKRTDRRMLVALTGGMRRLSRLSGGFGSLRS